MNFKEEIRMMKQYISKTSTSKELYERAKQFLPSGVSYVIRHFEPYPFYTKMAKGSKLIDVDENEYVDFWIGHLALILGHSPEPVIEAVKRQIESGTHFGTCHPLEIELAEEVAKLVPCAEMIRYTNTGTEAAMYAIRLARAFTRRKKIVKFEGGWHGGYDALDTAVKPPFEIPESAGLTEEAVKHTISAPYNDLEGTIQRIKNEEIAAVIIEPVLGAGGGIPADKEFLKGLKELCEEKGALLIFDEVITGFRLAPGGAQQFYGIVPDLAILGKILGGGFPIGAVVGRRDVMELFDALKLERPNYVFQGGTFCGNPVSLTAGLKTLKLLEDGTIIGKLNRMGDRVREELKNIFEAVGVDVQVTGVSSLFHTHFTKNEVKNVEDVMNADRKRLLEYHLHLIENGVFFLPTKTGGLCSAHSEEDLEKLFREAENYARKVR